MSEKKNTGKKAVIAVIVIALIVVIIALAVVISGKSKKGGSKSATEAGTESGSETMRSGQFDIDYAKQVTKLADYSGVAITVSNDYEICGKADISDQCASVIWCRCVQAGYRS